MNKKAQTPKKGKPTAKQKAKRAENKTKWRALRDPRTIPVQ